MVLRALRSSSRAIVVVLIASFWGVLHRDASDPCGAGNVESHDESRHALEAASKSSEPDHCAVCHSVRSPRRPFGPAVHGRAPLVTWAVVDAPETAARRAPALDRIPARAPPASSI
jgi:hypothetical protein